MKWEYLTTVYFMQSKKRKYMLHQERMVQDVKVHEPLKKLAATNYAMFVFKIPLLFTLRIRGIHDGEDSVGFEPTGDLDL